jgi:hypothetical protein
MRAADACREAGRNRAGAHTGPLPPDLTSPHAGSDAGAALEVAMRRSRDQLIRELEGSHVSLAAVFGSLIAAANIASALVTLAMAG